VQGELAGRLGGLRPDLDGSLLGPESLSRKCIFQPPRSCASCAGSAAAEGMHIQFKDDDIARRTEIAQNQPCSETDYECTLLVPLATPQLALEFTDFCKLPTHGHRRIRFVAKFTGQVDAIAYWWHVGMLLDDKHVNQDISGPAVANRSAAAGLTGEHFYGTAGPFMSTAPGWTACPDHWRQNLVPFEVPLNVTKDQVFEFDVFHDPDMIWFRHPPQNDGPSNDLSEGGEKQSTGVDTSSHGGTKDASEDNCTITPNSVCECLVHVAFSRSRLAALNDPTRRRALGSALDAAEQWLARQGPGPKLVVVLGGEGPLLPFAAASRGLRCLSLRILPNGSRDGHCDLVEEVTKSCLAEAGLLDLVTFGSMEWAHEESGAELVARINEALLAGHSVETAANQSTYRVAVVSEGFFASLDDPAASVGDGWGWDSLLQLWSMCACLRDTWDDRSEAEVGNRCEPGAGPAQLACRVSFRAWPVRAVLRGAFVQSQHLWDSLHDLKCEKEALIEGADLAAAFEVAEIDRAGQEDSGSGDSGDDCESGGRSFGYLRERCTGDAAVDAVPFSLSQWRRGLDCQGNPGLELVGQELELFELSLEAQDIEMHKEHCALWSRCSDRMKAVKRRKTSDGTAGKDGDCPGSKVRPSDELAHALAIWIDYELIEGGVGDSQGNDQRGTLLRQGPGVWHGRQGVLGLEQPIDLASFENVELRTTISPDGALGIRILTN